MKKVPFSVYNQWFVNTQSCYPYFLNSLVQKGTIFKFPQSVKAIENVLSLILFLSSVIRIWSWQKSCNNYLHPVTFLILWIHMWILCIKLHVLQCSAQGQEAKLPLRSRWLNYNETSDILWCSEKHFRHTPSLLSLLYWKFLGPRNCL